MSRKKKLEIRFELTHPAPGKCILWAIIPQGYSAAFNKEEWLKVQEFQFFMPLPPDPSLHKDYKPT